VLTPNVISPESRALADPNQHRNLRNPSKKKSAVNNAG
jgi:hypothetical protein